jgi:hypothetical protein
MTSVSVLPATGDAFQDVRDDGRTLRVTWHPSEQFFVLSIWRDGACIATSRLDRHTASALIGTMVGQLAIA